MQGECDCLCFRYLCFGIQSTMTIYSPFGRGRRKAVEKFTSRKGLWMLGIVVAILMGMMSLMLFGYLNANP